MKIKKSELRSLIKEEIKHMINERSLSREDWEIIDEIVRDVILNFKKITKKDINSMIPTDLDSEEALDRNMVEKTFPYIKKYVQKKYNIDIVKDFNGEILYKLDDAISNVIY